ncbi:hypothetical protein TEA_025581 [Camellia sinensis var. sinensis]|uniref:Alpha-N-acetylglucosaminidase tim-barrel domain-containing protein n=1 Tax=Camellia sinensis var. sinensis TaxID=542762 RepID=A0A4S4DG27_CAMSN|nr:hypothetical protein TEA_025581 [Camellia sinensis var. sinensis]
MSTAKFILLILIILLPISLSSSSEESGAIEALIGRLEAKRSTPSVQEHAAKAVLHRLLPTHVSSFQFKIVSKVPPSSSMLGFTLFFLITIVIYFFVSSYRNSQNLNQSMSTAKFILLILIILLPISLSSSSEESGAIEALIGRLEAKRSTPSVQEHAAKAVLHRLLPTHVSSFQFKIVSKVPPSSSMLGFTLFFLITIVIYFFVSSYRIEGITAVEIASGLHWYLKYWCGAHVSWDKTGGIQIASVPKPGSLPLVSDEGVIIQRPVPWNYYQNVVTSSYSYVWWDWERWEKEIDWMALQGVNLPLAFTGQESIWQKVFTDFNIRKQDLNDFFGGPAFLAWARMGNLHGWGGPLSQNWLDQQLVLQKQILSRMIELGMTPVLPSFSGNVPGALKDIFPSANITRLGDWNTVDGDTRWCCTFLLDPSDPLFVEIGKAFIKRQIKGAIHVS